MTFVTIPTHSPLLTPRVPLRSILLLAGRPWLAGETAADRNFCQGEQLMIQMETSSSETPGVSAPNADLADSASPVPQRRGKRTARDAALGPTREENTSQGSQEESCAKRQRLNLSTKGSCKARDSSCFFLRKLREIVESDCFQSIWWGDDENSIVIEETLFRTEVLGRTGPLHNLNIGCMKAFVRQLHLHGFFIVDSDLPTSASRAKFPAGGAASLPSEVRTPPAHRTPLGTGGIGGRSHLRGLQVGDIWVSKPAFLLLKILKFLLAS